MATINNQTSVSLSTYGNEVSELLEVIKEIPEGATYDISVQSGDRYYESSTVTITFKWSTNSKTPARN